MTDEIQPDQIRVTIETGAGYAPTERVTAALDELAGALREAAGAEVSGFSLGREGSIECTYFRSRSWGSGPTVALFDVGPTGMKALCDNEAITEMTVAY